MDASRFRRVRAQTIDGALWSGLGHAGQQAVYFAFSVVLARLLAPEQFGLLGMVLVVTSLAAVLGNLGITSAVIQRATLEDDFYATAFTLHLLLGLVLTVALAALAPALVWFYGEPQLLWLTRLVALKFVLAASYAVLRARVVRELDFRFLAVRDVLTTLAAGGVATAMALGGLGVYSLVGLYLFDEVASMALFWFGPVTRPRLGIQRRYLAVLFRFGSELTLKGLLDSVVRSADGLLIGKYLREHALGLYTRAFTLMLLPVAHISQVLNKVMFPAFSRLQQDRRLMGDICLQSIAVVGLVTFPLMAGLFVTAEHFVLTVYGARWAECIELIRILCVVGALQSVSGAPAAIFISLGETRKLLLGALASTTLILAGFAAGIALGSLRSFALIYAGINVALYLPRFWYVGRLVGLSPWAAVRALGGVSACTALMAIAVWDVDRLLPAAWPHPAALAVEVVVGVATYGWFAHTFGLRGYRDVRRILAERLQAWRSRAA